MNCGTYGDYLVNEMRGTTKRRCGATQPAGQLKPEHEEQAPEWCPRMEKE
jgi:hypothetical protein